MGEAPCVAREDCEDVTVSTAVGVGLTEARVEALALPLRRAEAVTPPGLLLEVGDSVPPNPAAASLGEQPAD